MPFAKLDVSSTNKPMHFSVGAVIKKDGKYLLIDRAVEPFGFAGIAGHVDEEESPEQALAREIREESGLKLEKSTLLFEEEIDNNKCSQRLKIHYWYLYECEVSGETFRNQRETKSLGWYSAEEIKSLNLEPVWRHWFWRLDLLQDQF